ncbi:MAG: ABC transporter substrate-binding protein [Propionibacteriales bacterium]|nr:ABC transporter substrate-binding protein [Propionibacteriales bacterium]
MTIRNVVRGLALASAMSLVLAACGSDGDDDGTSTGTAAKDLGLISSGTLKVCSDVPYPPFEDFDSTADLGYSGFDIDLVAAIAKGLGVKVEIKDSDFDALQGGILFNSRQCDLGASAMTINDKRKEKIGFTDGYYASKQSLLVPTGSDITSIADLAGKKVGVQKGTTGETYTAENAPEADRVQFSDDGKMYTALIAGQIDAILQDLPVNLDHQKDEKQAGKFTVIETYDTDENYGFGTKKDNTKLLDAVNEQLQALRDSGEYQTIYDKYFAVK